MKTIVVSAVNIRKGGTLTILRDCLDCLSRRTKDGGYRVVALVHNHLLAKFDGIEYIELPWTVKSWFHRLWAEYFTMWHLSKKIGEIDLWFSLHDATPRVRAKRQAVYCQTSFPVLRWNLNDIRFDFKIVLFSMLTRYVYRFRCRNNYRMVVQTQWLRRRLSGMTGYPANRFIIAPPERGGLVKVEAHADTSKYTFIYAATPDCHKNFELICRASELLAEEIGEIFEVILTINGCENKYSRWLYKKWGKVPTIQFAGFMSKDKLYEAYGKSDCLVFPSRVETWGLPISEYAQLDKPMLLANLSYSHETAAGTTKTAFFNATDTHDLKNLMKRLISGDTSFLSSVDSIPDDAMTVHSWQHLFELLLKD